MYKITQEQTNTTYNLIERINQERKIRGYSTRKFAEMCNMHQTQIVVILNHQVVPRVDTLIKILNALGLDLTITLKI